MSAANSSTVASSFLDDPLNLQPTYIPFYYSDKPDLFESVSDCYLTLAAPVVAYWFLSLVFHFLDTRDWKVLDKYRIHPSTEVASKNLVSRSTVVYAVIFQHIIQTLLGLLWLSHEPPKFVPHAVSIQHIASILQRPLVALGIRHPSLVVSAAQFVYWWGIPSFQLFASMFIIDTWQYFWHRGMHVNKFLYKHFHSWHHRLYVPYAFGALYNHPVEGFILDSLGAAIAELITGLSMRQAMVLFTLSTFKTVDDHCGYNFPWDPLQLMSGNNADYHDIHHQVIGLKSNFAQPFFVHWDTLLGTRMTRADIETRRRDQKARTAKAQ